ncbi:hypothetical protein GCM10023176_05210 [Micromonospora coerulea]|uniref:Uncharacterized protein n=1 Tax=Micromonospora coerulea TaxID=47856 RepID=A0ABP8S5I5_9ACTN
MARSDGTPDGSQSRHSSSRPQVRAPDGFPPSLQPLLARIADRRAARTEATLQADIRQLLLAGDFGLIDSHLDADLEAPVGGGRRIDIEFGYTIIEVKRRLQQSETVGEMHLTDNTNFVALRRHIRAGLARHPATPEIEAVVMEVLG